MHSNQELLAKIESFSSKVIELQQWLVSIPALGPDHGGDGELKKAEYVEQVLADIGFDEIRRYDAPDERVSSKKRPNIVAKIFGKNRAQTIWVCSHLDVVPAGDLAKWSSDPFQLVVDGDKLIGRGTEDNHQGLVSSLMAAKGLREAGVTPECSVGLLIVSDEETGSGYGLGHLLRHQQDIFQRGDWFIVPDAGDPLGETIEVAEKSVYWLKFHILGKQCHASTPQQGVNAMRAGAHLIVELEKLAQHFPTRDLLYDTPQSTFEPTKKEANIPNINTIPGDDVFYLDCRILPIYPLSQVDQVIQEIIQGIEKKFGVRVIVTTVQKEEAAPPTPSDAPVVRALTAAIRQVSGKEEKIIGIGGGTVAALLRRAGFPAVVWSTLDDVCHQPNEYARISSTLSDAAVMATVFTQKTSEA